MKRLSVKRDERLSRAFMAQKKTNKKNKITQKMDELRLHSNCLSQFKPWPHVSL